MMFMKPERKKNDKLLEFTRKRPCIVCGKGPSDPAHIRSVGAGGDDEPYNLVPLCRPHHSHQHKVGWMTFYKQYGIVQKVLTELGWQVIKNGNHEKLFHPDMTDLN